MYDVTPIIFMTSYQIYIISPILLSWKQNDYTWHIYEYVISYGLWMTKQPLYKASHLLYLCNHTHLIDDIIAYVYMSGLLCSYEGHLRNLHEACQGNTDASRGEVGAPVSLSSCHSDIVIAINFQQESVIITFWSIELHVLLEVSKGCEASCPNEADIGLSLGPPQGIQTFLHLVRVKMSLHSSHCREIQASFESGHLGVHSTWGSNVRVPLTDLLLREASSWGACWKLAYFLSQSQGIISPHETKWGAWSFPQVAVLK